MAASWGSWIWGGPGHNEGSADSWEGGGIGGRGARRRRGSVVVRETGIEGPGVQIVRVGGRRVREGGWRPAALLCLHIWPFVNCHFSFTTLN